jgi:hypothetical protein
VAGSESTRHLELKRLALTWALTAGYSAVATEVALPHLRFRLDVAAYRPARRGREAILGTTALFECKQVRSDFLRDSRKSAPLLARLERLHARKARLEAVLRVVHPTLRTGDSLFPEYESHDYARCGDELYLKVLAQIASARGQLYAQTKFEKLWRWRAVNLHYAVTEPGVLRAHELPDGWGLLVRIGDTLELAAKPCWQEIPDHHRLNVLHRIAVAGTRAVSRVVAGTDSVTLRTARTSVCSADLQDV